MSRATLRVLRATVEVRPLYTCIACGAKESGDRVTLTVDTPDDFNYWLHSQGVSNSHMPIGWAGYGLREHRCPRCAV